jgi:hypothetical protein
MRTGFHTDGEWVVMMMRACVWRTALAAGLCLAGLGLAGTPAVAAGSAATSGWQISYRLPVQNGDTDSVNAIAATGSGNAWGFGGQLDVVNGQAEGVPAAFHWNGTAWSQMRLPGSVREGFFRAASASSASDVWAISSSCEGCGTFAGRWNGTTWSWNSGVPYAYSVAALANSDVWVAAQAGLEHWNGHSWRTYTAPGPDGVSSVSGVAADEVWASGLGSGGLQPEAAFWNGKSWRLQKLPRITLPANGQALPAQVVADARDNVWMEGYIQWPDPATQLEDYKPFVLHWDGKVWSQVRIPASLPSNMGFTELAGDGGSGFWAVDVALQTVGTGITPAEDLVHYNGSKWTVEALPAIPGDTAGTTSVTGLFQVPGTHQVWAPATYDNSAGQPSELIFRYIP